MRCATNRIFFVLSISIFLTFLIAVSASAADASRCSSKLNRTDSTVDVISSIATNEVANTNRISKDLLQAVESAANNGKVLYTEPIEDLEAAKKLFGIDLLSCSDLAEIPYDYTQQNNIKVLFTATKKINETIYSEYHRKDGYKIIFEANTLWDGNVSASKEYTLSFPTSGYNIEETAYTSAANKIYHIYSVTDTDNCIIAQYTVFSCGPTNYTLYLIADESAKRGDGKYHAISIPEETLSKLVDSIT